ncbi:MAG: RNA polymerase sigma factor [Myxococcaceae bacterium]
MDPSLNELARRAAEGDKSALGTLCARLQGPVYRLSLRMLGDPDDAKDATQEILIKAVTHLSSFEGRSALTTWVFTLASRHLLQLSQRPKEQATTAEELAARLDQGLALAEKVSALNPTDAPLLERELQLACTHGMLTVLSRPERLAYVLADVLGASDRIGGEICEVTPVAFRQRLARARAVMRPLLQERCSLADPKNPCRCEKQAKAACAAGLAHPNKLKLAGRPVEPDPVLARADEQLGALRAMGPVFDRGSPLAAPRELWAELVEACPNLLQ